MSARLRCLFEDFRRENRAAFVAYLAAGDPNPPQTVARVRALVEHGADIIELGLPFSDPLADGPVNAAAAERALRAGATLPVVLHIVREIRRALPAPIVLYSYLNPLLAPGFERAVRRIADAGADGVLILDLPADEAGPYLPALRAAGLAPIFLVTPTSTEARMRRIARVADGFIYCVSRTGVTGARRTLSPDARAVLRRMRRLTRLPLALGFGISTPAQAAAAARWADAVVVGSALVERLHASEHTPAARAGLWRWVDAMSEAVHNARRVDRP
ncbi:MAG: tryptophan synthase subunit alpha [Kiritimatiellae bacterium]|nr:tryptophan synthase subunit alpha [Kiritimatiellia bacterium]